MSQLSQKINCLADPKFARIIHFQSQADRIAAIIERKWHGVGSNGRVKDVVAGFQESSGRMYINFGHSFFLENIETGHPGLDGLAKDHELHGFTVSLLPAGHVSLVEKAIRFEHAVVTVEGKGLSGIALEDVAIKVTTEGDITFPPFS